LTFLKPKSKSPSNLVIDRGGVSPSSFFFYYDHIKNVKESQPKPNKEPQCEPNQKPKPEPSEEREPVAIKKPQQEPSEEQQWRNNEAREGGEGQISSRLRSPAEGNPESRLLYFEVPEIRERGSEPDF